MTPSNRQPQLPRSEGDPETDQTLRELNEGPLGYVQGIDARRESPEIRYQEAVADLLDAREKLRDLTIEVKAGRAREDGMEVADHLRGTIASAQSEILELGYPIPDIPPES